MGSHLESDIEIAGLAGAAGVDALALESNPCAVARAARDLYAQGLAAFDAHLDFIAGDRVAEVDFEFGLRIDAAKRFSASSKPRALCAPEFVPEAARSIVETRARAMTRTCTEELREKILDPLTPGG